MEASVGSTEVKLERGVSYAYQLFILVMCVYALVALGVSVIVPLQSEVARLLDLMDWVVCVVFIVDFFRSLRLADNRWQYLRTWGWIDLLSSIPMLDLFRIGRAARLFRIIRVLRALRAARVLSGLIGQNRAAAGFYTVLACAFLLVVLGSLSVLSFEQHEVSSNIKTADDALWWAVTTVTTVGYGDNFPVTSEGRVVAAALMILGVGLFGGLSGAAAAWFMGPNQPKA